MLPLIYVLMLANIRSVDTNIDSDFYYPGECTPRCDRIQRFPGMWFVHSLCVLRCILVSHYHSCSHALMRLPSTQPEPAPLFRDVS